MPREIKDKLTAFFGRYRESTFEKGEIIVRAGQFPGGIMYLQEGQVIEYDILQNGNEAVVNIFKPQAFFPMSWAFNKTPNRFFFEARTKSVVRQAPREDVLAFLRKNPDVVIDLVGRVFRGTDGILQRMLYLMGGDALSRLQFELLNSAYRFGEILPDGTIRLALTEGDLAKRSGLARETVSRNLQDMKTGGIVTVTQGNIILKDIRWLESQVDSGV